MRTINNPEAPLNYEHGVHGEIIFKDETAEFAQDGTQLVERCGLPDIYYAMITLINRAGMNPNQERECSRTQNPEMVPYTNSQIIKALYTLFANKEEFNEIMMRLGTQSDDSNLTDANWYILSDGSAKFNGLNASKGTYSLFINPSNEHGLIQSVSGGAGGATSKLNTSLTFTSGYSWQGAVSGSRSVFNSAILELENTVSNEKIRINSDGIIMWLSDIGVNLTADIIGRLGTLESIPSNLNWSWHVLNNGNAKFNSINIGDPSNNNSTVSSFGSLFNTNEILIRKYVNSDNGPSIHRTNNTTHISTSRLEMRRHTNSNSVQFPNSTPHSNRSIELNIEEHEPRISLGFTPNSPSNYINWRHLTFDLLGKLGTQSDTVNKLFPDNNWGITNDGAAKFNSITGSALSTFQLFTTPVPHGASLTNASDPSSNYIFEILSPSKRGGNRPDNPEHDVIVRSLGVTSDNNKNVVITGYSGTNIGTVVSSIVFDCFMIDFLKHIRNTVGNHVISNDVSWGITNSGDAKFKDISAMGINFDPGNNIGNGIGLYGNWSGISFYNDSRREVWGMGRSGISFKQGDAEKGISFVDTSSGANSSILFASSNPNGNGVIERSGIDLLLTKKGIEVPKKMGSSSNFLTTDKLYEIMQFSENDWRKLKKFVDRLDNDGKIFS